MTSPKSGKVAAATDLPAGVLHPRRPVRGLLRPVLHQPRPHRPQRQPRRMLAGLPPALRPHRQRRQPVASNQHLLSMKDNNQSANLRALADAGISSFIEGRYKDMAYVKNITAHYRLSRPDRRTRRIRAPPPGAASFLFQPAGRQGFNRGATDFLERPAPPTSALRLAQVRRRAGGQRDPRRRQTAPALRPHQRRRAPHNGDGLSFLRPQGRTRRPAVNRAEKIGEDFRVTADAVPAELFPAAASSATTTTSSSACRKEIAERRIAVDVLLSETPAASSLTLTDETGRSARADAAHAKEPPRTPSAPSPIRGMASPSSAPPFSAPRRALQLTWPGSCRPAPTNGAAPRRRRQARSRPHRRGLRRCPPRRRQPPVPYPENRAQLLPTCSTRRRARFTTATASQLIEAAYEANRHTDDASLMITKLPALQLQSMPERGEGHQARPG